MNGAHATMQPKSFAVGNKHEAWDMSEDLRIKVKGIEDQLFDRRSGIDRRQGDDSVFFEQGGVERRGGIEPRKNWLCRDACIKAKSPVE